MSSEVFGHLLQLVQRSGADAKKQLVERCRQAALSQSVKLGRHGNRHTAYLKQSTESVVFGDDLGALTLSCKGGSPILTRKCNSSIRAIGAFVVCSL